MAPGLQSIALFSQIVVDHAEGCTITDVDGNEYLDFIAGIAVGSVGHSHPHYIKRLKEQLERSTFGSFTTETRALFLKIVASLLPEGITHLQLFSGGAEAVEAAFRLAKSVTKKFEFIGFWGGFHGKSQGVMTTFEQTLADVLRRDEQDTTRLVAPLRQADDAIRVDTSSLTVDQAVEHIVGEVRAWSPR